MYHISVYFTFYVFIWNILSVPLSLKLSIIIYNGVSLTVQDLLRQDARIQDLNFNISEMKVSIASLISVQIMAYLGALNIIYEITRYE